MLLFVIATICLLLLLVAVLAAVAAVWSHHKGRVQRHVYDEANKLLNWISIAFSNESWRRLS